MMSAENTAPMFPARRTFLFSAGVCAAIFLLSLVAFLQLREAESADIKELISQNAVLISGAVQNAFLSEIEAIKRMADRWEFSGGTPQDAWRRDAKNYVQDIPGLEIMAWVKPDAQIGWAELRADAVPHNFYASPDMRERITKASRGKGAVSVFSYAPSAASAIKLIVLIALYNDHRFDGFIVGGFDGGSLIYNNISPLVKKYYVIALPPFEDNTPAALLPFTGWQDIHLQDVTLQMKLWPTHALLDAKHSVLPVFVLIAGSFFAVIAGIIYFVIHRILWQAEKIREQGRSLYESEASFKLLVEGVADYAIYMLDKEGYIKSWNSGAERIKQYKAEEILGQHFSQFYTPEDCAAGEPARALGTACATGKYIAEGWRVRKNGERFWASVVIDVLTNKNGDLIGYAKITRDITAIKTAEQEREALMQKLVDSNSELERFAFIASHDLQEPLRLICNFSALLQGGTEEFSDEARQYIGIIENAARRMHSLILDLLEYARVGSQPQLHEIIDVSQCMKYVTDTLKVAIQNTQAEITAGHLPVLHGSPVHFSLLLQNLIANAIKYQPPGAHPVIHIHAASQGDEWLFSVKDNGIGMKPEYLEQIFEPFRRLHGNEVYSGTGMGLAICRKIVSRMGGRIWAQSSPGESSIFYFTVPRNVQS